MDEIIKSILYFYPKILVTYWWKGDKFRVKM